MSEKNAFAAIDFGAVKLKKTTTVDKSAPQLTGGMTESEIKVSGLGECGSGSSHSGVRVRATHK